MDYHILTLPDGRQIASGAPGAAIIAVSVTGCVNTGESLMPGAVCPAVLEAALFDDGTLRIAAGDRLQLSDSGGNDLGCFYALEVARQDDVLTVTGWDCLGRLETDLTGWLRSLSGWPYALGDFAAMVCAACGLRLHSADIPNGGHPVPAFSASGVTGRQLLSWAAQAAGRFCRAVGEDGVEFAWYDRAVTPRFCYQGSVSRGGAAAPFGAVGIRRNDADVGVLYPENGENPLYITGNYLLTADADTLKAAAQVLYGQLQDLSWVSCTLQTDTPVKPGDRVQLTDGFALAMEVQKDGQLYTVRSFGPRQAGRDPVRSVYKALSGRVLELRAELEDVHLRLEQMDGAVQSAVQVQVDVDALRTRVEHTEQTAQGLQNQASVLTQRSDSLELAIVSTGAALEGKADREQLQEITEHFRFDGDGLTITNSTTGMGIGISQERILFTGGSSPTTVIYPSAMATTNLQVQTRLDLGQFSFLPRSNGNLSFRFTGGM